MPLTMGRDRLPRSSFMLLLLVLFSTNASNSAEPQYMVLVPYLLHTATPEKVCLLLSHLNETVTLSASLETFGGNRSLFADLVTEKDLFRCVSFTLPRISSSSEVAFFTVQIKGPTQDFRKKKTVLIKNDQSLVFVQTDKPIYKPGQTVKFRIVSVDENFHPLNELIPLVYLENPKRSRIGQWQNLQLESGLKQLAFPLSSEPIQGSYKVVVKRESGGHVEHLFTVEEFVVPKFEVKVQVPKIISIMDKKVKISVCGIYTYGKPVPGLATVRMCRNLLQSFHCKKDFCEEFSQQLNSNGCTTKEVNTNLFHIKSAGYEMELNVEAKIREEGTELEFTGHGTSKITNIVTRLEFVKVESHFRRGIPFSGQVLLVDGNNVPISNKVISIFAHAANYVFHATTNEQGLAEFSINTTNIFGTQLFITASHEKPNMCISFAWLREEHQTAFHSASQVYSLSGSYVRVEPVDSILPCGQTQTLKAHYTLRGSATGEMKELTFYYLIMAKGGIVRSGTHVLPVEPEDGSFSLSFPVTSDVAPIARLLIFTVLPNGEVIGDSERFEIENCLTNKVNLSFSPAQSLPASHAHLRVTASPQSLCALRAVDQSVLLMKPEAELSPSLVYNLLTTKDLTYFPENLEDEEDKQEYCVYPNVIGQGLYIEKDIYSFLKDMGLKVLTNSRVRKPQSCSRIYQHEAESFPALPMSHRGLGGIGGVGGLAGPHIVLQSAGYNVMHENNIQSPEPVSETVRSYFPETWIWELAVVDSSGVAEVGVTVPDTITEWKAGALCLSNDTGLGLSLPASLRAFQPFFVELTMPYSVIRGEAFTLKATILNYLPKCIRVKVQLEASTAFLAVQNTKGKESYCICVNERQTVSWAITPKTLGNVNFTVSAESVQSLEMCGNELAEVPETGRKDTVIKTLLVEPEGIEQEKTFNSMTCASGTEMSEQLSLKLPENVVKESARASFSVLGDILGSALQNIQNLLRMPYGCGEQNMVLFAPNIYVLNYLNETQQLTSEIKSKAIGYLISGYQRQLNYKHQDGSYSTFGEKSIFRREEGNTWLTAFVLQTFAQARTHIFIDEAHITEALTWLSQKQKDNGCFRSSGSLFNNAIKGGVEDEVTLSVYITIALRQSALPVTHPVVQKALFCLESTWNTVKEGTQGSHTYTKALLAYAFALMGNQDRRREILNSLDKEAVKEDNSVHWERSQKPRATESYFYQPRAPSAEVEMTSYVLLAYLTAQPAPSSEDLTSASHIVKWITKQQNSYGGFSSTQDTVVALHALSRYGAATFTRSQKTAQVTIRDSQTFSTKLQVDSNNLLLLQQVSLPEVPGEYVITVTGERCVYLQTSMKYNILPEKVDSPFALEVQTLPQTCDGVEAHTSFQISLNVSYRGSRSVSNMVIVDVKMVSGFIPLKPTVKMLEKSSHVSRTEVSINHVIIYVEEVTDKTLNFSFTVVQDIPVRDLKPAIVKVYDYYETDESATAEYIAPCTTGTEQENV